MSLGFSMAGFRTLAAADNFRAACETYRLNHPQVPLVEGDLTQRAVHEQLTGLLSGRKVDVVIGGPPCQGFSHAGKRLVDNPRNSLFREFVEVVARTLPGAFVMENVPGILSADEGRTFASIGDCFSELGYRVEGRTLAAVEFGVPQRRKRVLIIGRLQGSPGDLFPESRLKHPAQHVTVRDALSDLPDLDVGGGADVMPLVRTPSSAFQAWARGLIGPEDLIRSQLTLPAG